MRQNATKEGRPGSLNGGFTRSNYSFHTGKGMMNQSRWKSHERAEDEESERRNASLLLVTHVIVASTSTCASVDSRARARARGR